MNNTKQSTSIDYIILWPTLTILTALCLLLLFNPDEGTRAIKSILTWVEFKLGWVYLISVLLTTIFSLWLAFGRYGKVKLCAPGETPDFSVFSWFSMIFMTTMAASIMVWGFVEPAFYFKNPPYGLEAFSNEAYEWSLTQTMFHWSPIPYSVYVPFSVTIAYYIHVRKEPFFRVSRACESVIGKDRATGWTGKAIDILVLFGVIGGMSTSFGLAIPVVLESISSIFGIEPSPLVLVTLLFSWTLVFGASIYRGLEKGIKVLSNFNVILATVFITLVFVLGPSLFAVKMGVNSLGQMLQNFIRLSTFMDPIEKTGFVESWTVFYWAWYIGFAAAVGLFIARISKGRTIRDVVMGSTVAISASVFIIQSVFGSHTIGLQLNGVLDVANLLDEIGQNSTILEIVRALPMGNFMVIMHTLLLFTFVATSLDSTAFTCSAIATKQLSGDEEPTTFNRLLWAVILLAVTGTLTAIGGLNAIQVSALLASVPLLGIILLMCLSIKKMLEEDFPNIQQDYLYINYLTKEK